MTCTEIIGFTHRGFTKYFAGAADYFADSLSSFQIIKMDNLLKFCYFKNQSTKSPLNQRTNAAAAEYLRRKKNIDTSNNETEA